MRTFKPDLKKPEMLSMLGEVCPGQSTDIGWKQFRAVAARMLAKSHAVASQLFDSFDINGQGKIGRAHV